MEKKIIIILADNQKIDGTDVLCILTYNMSSSRNIKINTSNQYLH